MLISTLIIVYNWTKPQNVKGLMISDWGYLISYLHQTGYVFTQDVKNFLVETFLWNSVPALIAGWIGQYFIEAIWEGLDAEKAKPSIEAKYRS